MDLGQVAVRPAPGILAAGREAARGTYPPRYGTDVWDQRFRARLEAELRPAVRILDVGGGAQPSLSPDRRPEDCEYVGMDISSEELRKAPPGSYDEQLAADVVQFQPQLEGRFDLVVSWFVLEHVAPLDVALDNMRRYLKPGGVLIAQLAGGRSPSGLINRVVPHSLAKTILKNLLAEDPERVFPAHYDRCWQSALVPMMESNWDDVEVTPLHTGAGYLRFSRLLTGIFIAYEEWAYRGDREDLATYYLIVARRPR